MNAHCLAWDYDRAAKVAPYGDDAEVRRQTEAVVGAGHPVLQVHKLGKDDAAHAAELLDWFNPPEGAEVLDAGCGVGEVATLMHTIRPDLRFTLLNISRAQLNMCPAFPKIRADFHDLPIVDGSFDGVMFNYSLGHGLLDACISEAARVLRENGVLFIYDIATEDHGYVIERVGYRPHSKDEVREACLRHGLKPSVVIDNPNSSTADFRRLFGDAAYEQYGFDRTRPVIYRFVK